MPKKIVPPKDSVFSFDLPDPQPGIVVRGPATTIAQAQGRPDVVVSASFVLQAPAPGTTPVQAQDALATMASAIGACLPASKSMLAGPTPPTPMNVPLALGDVHHPLEIVPRAQAPDAAGDKVRKAVELLLRVSCDTASVKRLLSLPNAKATEQAAQFIIGQAVYGRYKLRGAVDESRLALANTLLQWCAQLLDAGVGGMEATALPAVEGFGSTSVLYKTLPQIAGLFVDVAFTRLLLRTVPNAVHNLSVCRHALAELTHDATTQNDVNSDDSGAAFPVIAEALNSRFLRGSLRAASDISHLIAAQILQTIASESDSLQAECMAMLGEQMIEAEVVEMVQGMVSAAAGTSFGAQYFDIWIAHAALHGRTSVLRLLLRMASKSPHQPALGSTSDVAPPAYPHLLSMVVQQPKLSRMRTRDVCELLSASGYDPRATFTHEDSLQPFAPPQDPAACAAANHDTALANYMAQQQRDVIAKSSAQYAAHFDTLSSYLDAVPPDLTFEHSQQLSAALVRAKNYVALIHTSEGFGNYCEASAYILQALAPVGSDASELTPCDQALATCQSANKEFNALREKGLPAVNPAQMKKLTAVLRGVTNDLVASMQALTTQSLTTNLPAASPLASPNPSASSDASDVIKQAFEKEHRIFLRVRKAIALRVDPNDTSVEAQRQRIKDVRENLIEIKDKLLQHYGPLLTFVLRGQNRALGIFVESGAPFSLSSLAHAFTVIANDPQRIPGAFQVRSKDKDQLIDWLIKAARTSEQALTLLDLVILVGTNSCAEAVVAHILAEKIDISPLLSCDDPALLHCAIARGDGLVELLSQVVSPFVMRAWVRALDDKGSNALFLASRRDSASLPLLLSYVDELAALRSMTEYNNQTLVEDALYHKNIKALRVLWALPELAFDPSTLTELPSLTRTILVNGPSFSDEVWWHALRRIPQGDALLRIASGDMLAKSIRENNESMMAFVLQHYASHVSTCDSDEMNILQVVASCDAVFALSRIQAYIPAEDRRVMARARRRGVRAEALTRNDEIAAAFNAWRHWKAPSEQTQTQSPPGDADAAAKKAARREMRAEQAASQLWAGKIRASTTRLHQEALLQDFIAHVQKQCAQGPSDEAYAALVAEGWTIIDALDMYGLGHVFGQHYARHHRKIKTDALRARLNSGAVDGASHFGPQDSVGLMQARQQALALVLAAPGYAAMERCLVHVRQENVSGAGYVLNPTTQAIEWFERSRTIRFVIRHDPAHDRLNVISCFPVPDASVGPHGINRVIAAQA